MPSLRQATKARRLWELLAILGAARGASASDAFPDTEAALSGVSPVCQSDLRSYALCTAKSGLYAVCTNVKLLNTTGMQVLLRCGSKTLPWADRLRLCQEKCLRDAGLLINGTVDRPCSAEIQAMHGFNAGLNIFTIGGAVGELNLSSAIFLPFPNFKSPLGPATVDFGKPSKCVEVESADYCVLTGQLHPRGLLGNPASGTGGLPKPFSISYGTCLPKSCNEAELNAFLAGLGGGSLQQNLGLKVQCGFVRPIAAAEGASKQEASFLGWGGIPIEHISKARFDTGFWVSITVLGVILLLVAAGTCQDLHREARDRKMIRVVDGQNGGQEPTSGSNGANGQHHHEAAEPLAPGAAPRGSRGAAGALQSFLGHWSLVRNSRSFMRLRPADKNTFACLDAIRAFSMCQVILGHSYMYPLLSSGIMNVEQFAPPHGLVGTFWFMIVPGCFYGVDTFFLLSGFLCAHSLQRKVFSRPEFRRPLRFSLLYVKFVLMRVLRLLPAELVAIAFVLYILPVLGNGIMWNLDRDSRFHCYDGAGRDDCKEYWWTNVLFIQNIDKYLGKCMAHTWYLGVDMQLYLTAPFFGLCYGANRKLGWGMLSLTMIVGVVLPMAMMAHYGWVPDNLLGGRSGFGTKVYMKPWCRMMPFLIGIALAWLWEERLQAGRGRHTTLAGAAVSYGLALLGLGLCFASTFGRALMYQCDLEVCSVQDKNPAGKPFMYLWTGFAIPAWSLGVAIIIALCFQDRFIPMFQGFLHQPFWQPLAKLTYSAYLIHTSVLILSFCQQDAPVIYSATGYFFSFVSFVVLALGAAYVLHILVEKPLANLQAKALGGAE